MRSGFSLIEVLIVVAVVALLIAILVPSLRLARFQARLTRVRGELYQIAVGLEAYHETFKRYPYASDACFGGGADAKLNYSHLPLDLAGRYLMARPEDPFNPGPGASYKYRAPGLGWQNGFPGGSIHLWVPEDFPYDNRNADIEADRVNDRYYSRYNKADCPVEFVVWSVGPAGPLGSVRSGQLHYPVPKRTWYRRASGLNGQGVIPVIQTKKHGFVQWTP